MGTGLPRGTDLVYVPSGITGASSSPTNTAAVYGSLRVRAGVKCNSDGCDGQEPKLAKSEACSEAPSSWLGVPSAGMLNEVGARDIVCSRTPACCV